MTDTVQPDARLEFLIGRDARGHWVVVETHGLAGGVFVSERAASRYLVSNYCDRAPCIRRVDRILDPLDRTCAAIVDESLGLAAAA